MKNYFFKPGLENLSQGARLKFVRELSYMSKPNVAEFLEGTYINTLGSSKLKEINGYKIRLATIDELCTDINCLSSRYESWILNNYGGSQNNVYGYWTMTPYSNNSSNVYKLDPHGYINHNVAYYNTGVRPVINLLKSAIE